MTIIILIILVIIILLWNHSTYRRVAVKNLQSIEWELLDCYNYYKRNSQNVDYDELRQAVKHLDVAISNYQNIRSTLKKVNSEKIIGIIDRYFHKIASSDIITEINVEGFFEQITELRVAINDSLNNMKFGDISK